MTETWDTIIARWDTNIRLAKWNVAWAVIGVVILAYDAAWTWAFIFFGILVLAVGGLGWCSKERARCIEQAKSFGWKGAEE